MTKRADIRQAIETLLDAVGKPAGLTVSRKRVRPLRTNELPLSEIASAEEQVIEDQDSDGLERTYVVALTHFVKTTTADPEAELEELLGWAVAQLASDVSLGGFALSAVESGTEWFADEQEAVFAGARQEFEITFTTLHGEV